MYPDPSYVADTLAWCNEKRKEKSMEPLDKLPKGKKGDGESCPCGAATELVVGTRTYRERYDPINSNPLPYGVMMFVESFDNGLLPQYDAEV